MSTARSFAKAVAKRAQSRRGRRDARRRSGRRKHDQVPRLRQPKPARKRRLRGLRQRSENRPARRPGFGRRRRCRFRTGRRPAPLGNASSRDNAGRHHGARQCARRRWHRRTAARHPGRPVAPDPALTTPPGADAPAISIPGLDDSGAAAALPVVAAGPVSSGVATPDTLAAQTEPAPASGAAGELLPGQVKLVVEQGMTVGKQFVLGDPEILVGREDDDEGIYPDIDLSDQDEGYVHRRHASLKFVDRGLTVMHLGGATKRA